jgi:SNF2 family DNA or RNA helicase
MIHPLWKGFTYFAHQLEGIEWMLEKETKGTKVPNCNYSSHVTVYGGLQCDDMGLGKTIQIASVIYNNIVDTTLLIAPLAMLSTWSEVCQRMGVAVYISNYEKLYHCPSLFKRKWNRIVLDEAHKIRNGDSYLSILIRKLVAPIRWAVTGTPLVNSLKDIVSLMAFMGVPYSKLWKWEERYLQILPNLLLHRSLNALRSVIQGAPPIPEINHLILPFTTKEEEEFYFGVQGASDALLKKYAKDTLSSTEQFKLLLRLRQISVYPQVFINAKRREDPKYNREDWSLPSTKFEKIKEIIEDDADNHKYIIFCQFYDEMRYLHDFILENGLAEMVLMYNGSMNQEARTKTLKQSKESTVKTVMLLQLQAGGVGLNLQEYDRIIFISPWWTAALMDQAVARAVRMGQTQVVKVYHLQLAAETDKYENDIINIDELINKKADEKRELLEYIFSICSVSK